LNDDNDGSHNLPSVHDVTHSPAFKVFRGLGEFIAAGLIAWICERILEWKGVDWMSCMLVEDEGGEMSEFEMVENGQGRALYDDEDEDGGGGREEEEEEEGEEEEEEEEDEKKGGKAGGKDRDRKKDGCGDDNNSDDNNSDDGDNIPLARGQGQKRKESNLLLLKSLQLLFFYFLSTLLYSSLLSSKNSTSYAPFVPLLMFATSIMILIHPVEQGKQWLKIILLTVKAPFTPATFRDGFIGDIITSLVRPLQDLAFTFFYFLSFSNGWLFAAEPPTEELEKATTDESDIYLAPVMKSWLLNRVVLPACVISPLWWRFCQNLRMVLSTRTRWPHLGNALKYFLAAQVALVAIYDPSVKGEVFWIASFVITTAYQLFWDFFMDWDVFSVDLDNYRGLFGALNYKESVFHKGTLKVITGVNIFLRFFWMVSLIPPKTLDDNGDLQYTFGRTLSIYLTPVTAMAEMIRRGVWGLLRVEKEWRKNRVAVTEGEGEDDWKGKNSRFEKMPMSPAPASVSAATIGEASAGILSLENMSEEQIIIELAGYAFGFLLFGFICTVQIM